MVKYKFKKSQMIILSFLILFLFILFIYSLGTENYYKYDLGEIGIVDNIKYEVCQVGYNSNGSYIEARYSNLSYEISNYCQNYGVICNLTIINVDGETNSSILSYKNYSYNLDFVGVDYNYSENFNC